MRQYVVNCYEFNYKTMFDELEKYTNNGHFFFQPDHNLAKVSNVPKDLEGLYLIYALERGRVNLVFIGTKLPEGQWAPKMLLEDIEALDIYWYASENNGKSDDPKAMKAEILKVYKSVYGIKPRWN